MHKSKPIQGVFAAALTPLSLNNTINLDQFPPFLDFLASRGCHGALLFGTTGEGPSFSGEQRKALMRSAVAWRASHPGFGLLAGTGTPSLEETIQLTRAAFETGMDAVLVLPPYYFRNVSEEGLYTWYQSILTEAVPSDGALFGYHIPKVTGVLLSLDLIARLKDKFPRQFAGIKDSSADVETAVALGQRFGKDLVVMNGTDPLFSTALEQHAAGCITALANLISPYLRSVWDAHQARRQDTDAQSQLDAIRKITDRYAPAPPLLKYLAAKGFDLPHWQVCPPLMPLSAEKGLAVWGELNALPFNWRVAWHMPPDKA